MAASFKYRWLDALFDSKAPWIGSKHLLVACVLVNRWMTPEGGRCFPPAHLVADRTRLSQKSVYRAINDLAENGWVSKAKLRTSVAGTPGKGWAVHRLTPRFPDGVDTESTASPQADPKQVLRVDTQSRWCGPSDQLIPSINPLVNREEVMADDQNEWLADYERVEGQR